MDFFQVLRRISSNKIQELETLVEVFINKAACYHSLSKQLQDIRRLEETRDIFNKSENKKTLVEFGFYITINYFNEKEMF